MNDFAARPEYADPAQEVTADGRKPRPLPEGAAITVEHVVSRLEIADAFEGRLQVLVVLVAFDGVVGIHREQREQMNQP